eukprot:GHVU01042554.1.p1 GENE.GHVU01042554.1~~GHVU01042554.1.p1  ORF type:complete len:132 (-),score=2.29 GHVU01042554.1:1301-1696(-)
MEDRIGPPPPPGPRLTGDVKRVTAALPCILYPSFSMLLPSRRSYCDQAGDVTVVPQDLRRFGRNGFEAFNDIVQTEVMRHFARLPYRELTTSRRRPAPIHSGDADPPTPIAAGWEPTSRPRVGDRLQSSPS